MKTAQLHYRRVNITLREDTVRLLERAVPKMQTNRSRLIDEAVWSHIGRLSRRELRRRLHEGYARSGERDRQLVEEWFEAAAETWPATHARGR
jgi:metal-responsive CopG/Arc/MetJ family transcriptional regulator